MTSWTLPGCTELRELGTGAFGRVALVRRESDHVIAAVKHLSDQLLRDPGFVTRFRAEAKRLAEVTDPHVARLYQYVESDQGAALVMEAVDGVSLATVPRERGASRTGATARSS